MRGFTGQVGGSDRGERRRRAGLARAALVGVLTVLVAAFFRLQVLRSTELSLLSEKNRLRAVTVPAPRGTIYDREGRVLAENLPGYAVSLLPSPRDTLRAALERLRPFLALSAREVTALLEKRDRFPTRPLMVRDDATFEEVAALEERRPLFRHTVVEMRPRRHYPFGHELAHVLGYVGEIDERELASPAFEGYEPGRQVGKTGLERQYEARLSGTPGVRYVEVNALGSIVREFGPRPGGEPVPGGDLHLGLDLALQSFTDSLFPAGRKGGVVALDPRTGQVLVLYSSPSYDLNRFVGGVDADSWTRLTEDPDEPLLNRVTGAAYPPGSTFKLAVAVQALRAGDVRIDETMEIPCRGALRFGNRTFRCWRPEGHGVLDLAGAIRESCNVYFYQLGLRLGVERLLAGARRLGYGEPTGLDLPVDARGLLPPSTAWLDRRYGPRGWTEAVSLNLAIGQGENAQTPLRQALFYTALATGGSPPVPHLRARPEGATRRADWSLDLPEERRLELVEALVSVVNHPEGTAYPRRLNGWTMAGKTGTAQNPHGDPHSWFVAFAPARDPEIVVAGVVEFGHPDNTVSLAVPLVSRIVRRYLRSRHPEVEGPPEPAVARPGTRRRPPPAVSEGGLSPDAAAPRADTATAPVDTVTAPADTVTAPADTVVS